MFFAASHTVGKCAVQRTLSAKGATRRRAGWRGCYWHTPGALLTRATRFSVDCPVLLNSSSSFTLPNIGLPVFGSKAGTRIAIFLAAQLHSMNDGISPVFVSYCSSSGPCFFRALRYFFWPLLKIRYYPSAFVAAMSGRINDFVVV